MSTNKKSIVHMTRLKVSKDSIINLPEEVIQILDIKSGDELIITVKDDKAEIRKAKSVDELAGSLKGISISDDELMAYSGFRNAYDDAYDFFRHIKGCLPYDDELVIGMLYDGRCYLQLQKGDLRKTIHLAYFETLDYQDGIITINPGIEEYLDNDTDRDIINKNREIINKALSNFIDLQPFDDSSYILLVAPDFLKSEKALIYIVIDRIVRAID